MWGVLGGGDERDNDNYLNSRRLMNKRSIMNSYLLCYTIAIVHEQVKGLIPFLVFVHSKMSIVCLAGVSDGTT